VTKLTCIYMCIHMHITTHIYVYIYIEREGGSCTVEFEETEQGVLVFQRKPAR